MSRFSIVRSTNSCCRFMELILPHSARERGAAPGRLPGAAHMPDSVHLEYFTWMFIRSFVSPETVSVTPLPAVRVEPVGLDAS